MAPQTTIRVKNLRSDLTLEELKSFIRERFDSADLDTISLCRQRPSPDSPQVATVTLTRTDQFYKAQKPRQYSDLGSLPQGGSKRSVNVDVDFLGFTVLYDGLQGQEPNIDFVFLHGLNGHAFRTFSCTNDDQAIRMWPRDFLKFSFPNARILTYGYNANVFKNTSLAVREDFRDALLASLSALRAGTTSATRPIVFLGHSLGGLVIKSALLAASEKPSYLPIHQSTKGVVFFGTPHRGSKMADFAKILQTVTAVAFWNERPPIRLIESLHITSSELVTLHDAWLALCTKYNFVISCRECRPMVRKGVLRFVQAIAPITQELVVDKISASVETAREDSLPRQNCDHRDVCTFTSSTEEEYQNLVHFIERGLAHAGETAIEAPTQLDQKTAINIPAALSRNSSDTTDTASLSAANSETQEQGPSPEMKHIIVAFETCAIAEKLSAIVKFFNEDAACIPPLCVPVDLESIFEATDHSVRSFDENYLRQLVNEYRDGKCWDRSSKYSEFLSATTEFTSALDAAGHLAKAAFTFLWLLSRVLGRQMFLQVYRNVIVAPAASRSAGLDFRRLDLLHKSIQTLMSITIGNSWTSFDDERADYGVDLWCDLDDGTQIDVCKQPLGLLERHEKVLLPVTRRDLWLAENLVTIFGIGCIVENAEEDRAAQQRESPVLWRLDPADEYSTESLDMSSFRGLLRYLEPNGDLGWLDDDEPEEAKSKPEQARDPDIERRFGQFSDFIKSIKERKRTADPDESRMLEEEISLRLVAGFDDDDGDGTRSQVFFSAYAEARLLNYAQKDSFWLRRYLKAALTFNRAVVLCQQPMILWKLHRDNVLQPHVADVLPLYAGDQGFTLEVGPVKWHRRIGSHAEYAQWDCLQVGRLLWDIPARAMAVGWKMICQHSDLLRQQSLTAIDCLMILCFQAALGYEYCEGRTIPIPIFAKCFEAAYWQKILPKISQMVQWRQNCNKYAVLQPIEEPVPPFGEAMLTKTDDMPPASVLLLDRSHLYPLDSRTTDEFGVEWEDIRIDLEGAFASHKIDLREYNIVCFDKHGRIHNLAIGKFSRLASERITAAFNKCAGNRGALAIPEKAVSTKCNTWEAIQDLLGLKTMEDPDSSTENLDHGGIQELHRTEDGKGKDAVPILPQALLNVPPSAPLEMQVSASTTIEEQTAAQMSILRNYVSSNSEKPERTMKEVLILRAKEQDNSNGGPGFRGWLGPALLPYLLEGNNDLRLDVDEYQKCDTALGKAIVSAVQRWIDDEEDFRLRAFATNHAAYLERFSDAKKSEEASGDAYLDILEKCVDRGERFTDTVVLDIAGRHLNERFIIFEEEYDIEGSLKLVQIVQCGDESRSESAIWLLRRGYFTYDLLVPAAAADHLSRISMPAGFYWETEDVSSTETPVGGSTYVFMMGIAVPPIYGGPERSADQKEYLKAWGRQVMLTWSNGLTAAQNYYLSHTDIYQKLQGISRPKPPAEESQPKQGERQLEGIHLRFENWRSETVESIKAKDSAAELCRRADELLQTRDFVPALRLYAQVLDVVCPALQSGSGLVKKELAVLAFDSAIQIVIIGLEASMAEVALAYLGVADSLAESLLGAHDPNDPDNQYLSKVQQNFMRISYGMQHIPEAHRNMIYKMAGDKTKQILNDSGDFHSKNLDVLCRYIEERTQARNAATIAPNTETPNVELQLQLLLAQLQAATLQPASPDTRVSAYEAQAAPQYGMTANSEAGPSGHNPQATNDQQQGRKSKGLARVKAWFSKS